MITDHKTDDGLPFFRGFLNALIPAVLLWLLIWELGTLIWEALK